MMDILTIFITSFFIAFSGAAMPGPLMTATISESARRGPLAGPVMMVGHSLLELGLVSLLMLGLAPFLKQDWVFATIAVGGSVMLAGMAVSMLRAIPQLHIRLDEQTGPGAGLVSAGILLSLANPYWTLWWSTIGLTYILYSARFGAAGVAFFFVGHILGDLTWYSAISFAVGKGRRFLDDRHYRAVIGVCAVFLLALAGYFAWSGVSRVLAL
jgi:threonine/homoserine/homoserine lactone efflux protein